MAKSTYICTDFREGNIKVPFFVCNNQLVYTEEIHNLVTEKCSEEGFQECFLVGIEQSGKNIRVFLDSDKSITYDICKQISRYLEAIFDEKAWFGPDYVLEVSSAGLSRPLLYPRQFIKNIGRDLEVVSLENERWEGKIKLADEHKVVLEYEETRKENKKKIVDIIHKEIPYSIIKSAKIIARI